MPQSTGFGTRTMSERALFSHSVDSGRYSFSVSNRAFVIIFITVGCRVISFEIRSVPGLNRLDKLVDILVKIKEAK